MNKMQDRRSFGSRAMMMALDVLVSIVHGRRRSTSVVVGHGIFKTLSYWKYGEPGTLLERERALRKIVWHAGHSTLD